MGHLMLHHWIRLVLLLHLLADPLLPFLHLHLLQVVVVEVVVIVVIYWLQFARVKS
jgi:hypothetical protein